MPDPHTSKLLDELYLILKQISVLSDAPYDSKTLCRDLAMAGRDKINDARRNAFTSVECHD